MCFNALIMSGYFNHYVMHTLLLRPFKQNYDIFGEPVYGISERYFKGVKILIKHGHV